MGDVWSLGNSFWRDLGGAGVVRATLSYDITLRDSGPLSMTRSQSLGMAILYFTIGGSGPKLQGFA